MSDPKLTTADVERAQLARHASRRNLDSGSTLAPEPAEKKTSDKKKKPGLAGWKHFLAGAVAGVCEVAATQPLDTAKTNMQTNPGKPRTSWIRSFSSHD
jgi:hypothetical protein